MRLAGLVFGVALVGFVVFPVTEAGAAAAGLIAVALLPLLGYRDGTWSGLRWALVVPAAAVVADVLTFTPLSLQPETDPAIWTYVAFFYLPDGRCSEDVRIVVELRRRSLRVDC